MVANDHPVLVSDVRVFDGHNVRPRASVLVRDGVIAEVGESVHLPPDCEFVAGDGNTLLPGLIDAHTHTLSRQDLGQALTFGVCTELDMFGSPELMAEFRQLAAHDAGIADLRSAGTGATAPGGHPTPLVEQGMFPDFPTLVGLDEVDEFVARRVAEGSDYLKIIIDDGAWLGYDLPTLSEPQVAALVRAAHERGLRAVAHVGTHAAAEQAFSAGVDGLAHVFADRTPPEDFGRQAARADVFVIPTLSTWESKFGQRREIAMSHDPRLRPHIAPEVLDYVEKTWSELSGIQEVHGPSDSYARHATHQLRASGVPILAGTDAAFPRTAHGLGLHAELAALVDAGLSPTEALTAATATPAACFGLHDRGRIETGRRADLLLVRGDPTTDIDATVDIDRIWRGGVPLERTPERELS